MFTRHASLCCCGPFGSRQRAACIVWSTAALLLPALPAVAVPDADRHEIAAGVTVFGDDSRRALFHVVPSGVRPRQAADGGPEMTFKLARYSGSQISGDQGRVEINSVLRLGLVLEIPDSTALTRASEVLAQRHGRPVELRPLALRHLTARLLHPGTLETIPAEQGHEEVHTLWRERDIVLRLAPTEAELLEHILEDETVGLTLAWSAYAQVEGSPEITIVVSSSVQRDGESPFSARELAEAMQEAAPEAGEEAIDEQVVAAGALALRLTSGERARRVERYDIDAALPPLYPVLTSLCFTFADELSPDLVERIVEVEATALGGWRTRTEAIFSAERPERTAAPLAFEHAVDLQHPYRWRVLDIHSSGEMRTSDWTTADRWNAFIDITNAGLEAPPKEGGRQEETQ